MNIDCHGLVGHASCLLLLYPILLFLSFDVLPRQLPFLLNFLPDPVIIVVVLVVFVFFLLLFAFQLLSGLSLSGLF